MEARVGLARVEAEVVGEGVSLVEAVTRCLAEVIAIVAVVVEVAGSGEVDRTVRF